MFLWGRGILMWDLAMALDTTALKREEDRFRSSIITIRVGNHVASQVAIIFVYNVVRKSPVRIILHILCIHARTQSPKRLGFAGNV